MMLRQLGQLLGVEPESTAAGTPIHPQPAYRNLFQKSLTMRTGFHGFPPGLAQKPDVP
jgi:hypothetical protein